MASFYSLINKLASPDILELAYRQAHKRIFLNALPVDSET